MSRNIVHTPKTNAQFFPQIFTDEESFIDEMHKISSNLIVNKGNFVNLYISLLSSYQALNYSKVQAVAYKIVNDSSLH